MKRQRLYKHYLKVSMKPYALGISFVIFGVASLFVNKYILSILKFTFPTIFQGWQCFVSLIVLICIIKRRNSASKLRRCVDIHYLPEAIFFVCSIYAGSKALTKIPIPVFLGMQNLSLVSVTLLKMFLLDERPKNNTIFSEMVLLTACAFIWLNEQTAINPAAYFWIFIHVVSLGFCCVFEHVHEGDILDHEVLLLANNLFAFLSLAPCTFFFGDLQAVKAYPNLYFSKFYIGVVLSGVFSAFSSALYLQFTNQDRDSSSAHLTGANSLSGYTALSRIVAIILSQFVFERTLAITTIWCLISCLVVPAIQSSEANFTSVSES
ncbi:UDP-N-acetylglucosamine transporter TMEM241-like isoform X1 [Watersipora subatra]|uniref:UDP-N-acetylglucosamine transporter TMEM241-like isoform X1 n=1 Tax=Watersipora subatra TaxID=2589382 RepID=UPI00355AEED4